jgi:hypothetical protein
MEKIPLSTNKTSTNTQSKNKSDSSIIKMPFSSSIQRKGNSRGNSTRRVPIVPPGDKENVSNQTRSSSDISDDERMESQTAAHTVPRKVSPVHQYATKLTPTEYQCKFCSKVKIHSIS